VFAHAHVIPIDRQTVLLDQTVVVRAGRFASVGPAPKLKAPAGATRIAGRGKYLMPGMGEMHGHIPPPFVPAAFIGDMRFLDVANRITIVRGMLGHPGRLELRAKASRSEIIAPTLMYPPTSVVCPEDMPDPARTTAFSFGLSSVCHPKWVNRRPELIISVNQWTRHGRWRWANSFEMTKNGSRTVRPEPRSRSL
jgi:hypothetical protein